MRQKADLLPVEMKVTAGPNNLSLRQPSFAADGTAPRQWFRLKVVSDKVTEIYIMDEISRWGDSAQSLVQQIRAISDSTRIKLHLFSPGGDVMEGNEIYNALKAHKGGVDVEIGAFCASIATLIACCGEKVTMPKNGWYMVHNPWTFAMGEAAEFRKMADILDKMKGNLADVYVAKTGKDKDKVCQLMTDETWMTAQEAKDHGFIDEVVDVEDEEVETVAARFDLSGFRNCTRFIKATVKFTQETEQPTKPKGKDPTPQTPIAKTESSGIVNNYMKNNIRIFAGIIPAILASTIRPIVYLDPPKDPSGGGGTATAEDEEKRIKAAARQLYEAKMTRDKEIDDIVLAVRNRDKKDFSTLAAKFKQQDKTPDEFARAITGSDEFENTGVVGGNDGSSSIEVLGVAGLPKGSPGEVFVASDEYREFGLTHAKGGTRKHRTIAVQTLFTLQNVLNQIFHNATPTTSTGLTSIEKLPGVVTLGVRPLMVKDLIAPGATNNTTIRYIQEVSFTNTAATVAEGAAKPEALFVLSEVDAPVKKVAAWTKVTDELFADYLAVASFINMRLPYMVERTCEDQLLNGDGVGSNLTGILATAGIQTQAVGGDTRLDALYKAITKVRWGNLAGTAQGGFEPDAFVMHPTDYETIRLLKDGNNQYFGGGPFTGAYGNGSVVQFEMVWGKPVAVTPAIAQGKALCGAFRLCSQYFQRQGLTIESTNTDQDDFIKNLTTIRAEERLALAVYRPLGFCQVTGL
jgi:HK97 family phage major capsid protein/ATP-dependent Clp endopeptidase proteolytic subunit ClpP